MYYFLSLLTGVIVAVMVAANGGLTDVYGAWTSTVMIHIVGLTVISAIALVKRDKLKTHGLPWYYFAGGAVGVLTTVFLNLAFGRLSVSAILALSLFAQTVGGIIVDHFGIMGMKVHKFRPEKAIGLLLAIGGIAFMLTGFDALAVIFALASGTGLVISRITNGRLSEATNPRVSTVYNYIVGLTVSIFALLLLGRGETLFTDSSGFVLSGEWYVYAGGALGVASVVISNIVVMKISAFYLTLLLFIGQVFTGVALDVLISGSFAPQNLIGGIMVTAGLSVNMLLDRRRAQREQAKGK